ncbi:hypothetical protein CONPUDRAFT_166782 [Coniophora puteana RWD-64-598 SS2]|uniref:Uncharacterized protein n=1 Tax=Coniophora puteana (strain RWD-64-598) TaxID=741705 RepID=A0A5M3MI55_CONPW|nr:uncharacterized protein CONPUDRAFT_166782 [Coniophora puteana RWD-64-598 SS2]EIW78918.1 hypothetical protein CONPUDRAFT_166782 [Coniophora puteana RWD-64-598 SS2]
MSSTEVIVGRSYYWGILITMLFHGCSIAMFLTYASTMLADTRRGRLQYIYVVYGLVLIIVTTLAILTNVIIGQWAFVDDPSASGPAQFILTHTNDWLGIMDIATTIILDFMVNVLTLYRCFIIWGSRWSIVIGPGLILLATEIMAITYGVEQYDAGGSRFGAATKNIGISWFTLSIGFNNIVTVLVCTRLVMAKFRIGRIAPHLSRTYTGVIAFVIESAAPMSISGIIYLVTYGLEVPVVYAFSQIWGTLSSMTPHLIILRVSMGRAWSVHTAAELTSGNSLRSGISANLSTMRRGNGDVIELTGRSREQIASELGDSIKGPSMGDV